MRPTSRTTRRTTTTPTSLTSSRTTTATRRRGRTTRPSRNRRTCDKIGRCVSPRRRTRRGRRNRVWGMGQGSARDPVMPGDARNGSDAQNGSAGGRAGGDAGRTDGAFRRCPCSVGTGDGGAQRGGHGGRTGGNDGQFWARWQDPACRQRSFQWVPFGDCWSESYQETSAKCILHASRERVSNGKFRARRIENILGLVQHATARKVKLDQKLHQKLVCRTRARSSRTRSFRNLRTNARAQLHLNTKTC